MTFTEMQILYCQVFAAAFMGWDYFMPKRCRQWLDERANRYFGGVQRNVDKDIGDAFQFLIENRFKVLVSIIFLLLGYVSLKLGSLYTGQFSAEVAFFSGLVFLFFSAGGFLTLMNVLIQLVVPFGAGGLFRIVTTFLTRTEKGPIAGIGFLALLVSFAMRYANQTSI